MSKSKTVKMKFATDQFYVTAANKEDDLANPLYRAGEVYEIDEKMVHRWLKRGGEIVVDEVVAPEPAKVEDKSKEPTPPTEEQVEDAPEKVEDTEKSVPQKPQGHKPNKQGGMKRY